MKPKSLTKRKKPKKEVEVFMATFNSIGKRITSFKRENFSDDSRGSLFQI